MLLPPTSSNLSTTTSFSHFFLSTNFCKSFMSPMELEKATTKNHTTENQPLIVQKKPLGYSRTKPKNSYNTSSSRSIIRSFEQQVEEVKLAALAITFNIRLRSADMPFTMQERALSHTRDLLGAGAGHRRPNPTLIARSLKKEFDSVYGPAWHCVAGKSFGSFVTHSPGGFVYFSVDALFFLLFKTEVHVISQ